MTETCRWGVTFIITRYGIPRRPEEPHAFYMYVCLLGVSLCLLLKAWWTENSPDVRVRVLFFGGFFLAIPWVNPGLFTNTNTYGLILQRKSGQRSAVGGNMWSVSWKGASCSPLPPSPSEDSLSLSLSNLKEMKGRVLDVDHQKKNATVDSVQLFFFHHVYSIH